MRIRVNRRVDKFQFKHYVVSINSGYFGSAARPDLIRQFYYRLSDPTFLSDKCKPFVGMN